MSHREIDIETEDGAEWRRVHVGCAHFEVGRPAIALRLSVGVPVVQLDCGGQLVTPDELRALADWIDAQYGQAPRRAVRSPSDEDIGVNYGGTD